MKSVFQKVVFHPFLRAWYTLLFILLIHTIAFSQVKLILDTDMCGDMDDVGALAILHAMANSGEVEILAVCFNEVHESGAAAIDAINTWYGRGNIPVGIYKGTLSSPDNSKYLDALMEFPHDLSKETAPSAMDVYRQSSIGTDGQLRDDHQCRFY
ncbi:MAG: hypothetical protein ISS81_04775 [Candidatus Marinimicrobia bacterium]|nr:hypothetical protein [Candidatus Neomarinimicrobiota bacterium]